MVISFKIMIVHVLDILMITKIYILQVFNLLLLGLKVKGQRWKIIKNCTESRDFLLDWISASVGGIYMQISWPIALKD